MQHTRGVLGVTLALLVALAGCGQTAAPAPAATIAPKTEAAAPTAIPASPTKAAEPTKAPEPTATVKPAATPTVAPTAKPTEAAAPTYTDILTKAKAASEYSFETKTTVKGQSLTTKSAIKGAKFRAETTNSGVRMVTILDTGAKVGYQLMVDQKIAMKIDLAKVQEMAGNSSQQDPLADAKFVAIETVDGKPAAAFSGKTAAGAAKFWYWVEKGVVLKAEMTSAEGQTVIEYTNYVFAPQADDLFALPAGFQVMDLPLDIGKAPVKP